MDGNGDGLKRKLMLCSVRTPNHGCQLCRAFVKAVREGTRKSDPQLEERFAKHQRHLADTRSNCYTWYYIYTDHRGEEKLSRKTGCDYMPWAYDITELRKKRSCCGALADGPPCRFCP